MELADRNPTFSYSDLEEAEDQYQMALRTHLVNLDTLIKLHDSRLYALERNFHQELRTLQADFNKEKGIIVGNRRLQDLPIEKEEPPPGARRTRLVGRVTLRSLLILVDMIERSW